MDELDVADGYFLFWHTTPTLMIGKYQNTFAEINIEFAKENNISIVRRITGSSRVFDNIFT